MNPATHGTEAVRSGAGAVHGGDVGDGMVDPYKNESGHGHYKKMKSKEDQACAAPSGPGRLAFDSQAEYTQAIRPCYPTFFETALAVDEHHPHGTGKSELRGRERVAVAGLPESRPRLSQRMRCSPSCCG